MSGKMPKSNPDSGDTYGGIGPSFGGGDSVWGSHWQKTSNRRFLLLSTHSAQQSFVVQTRKVFSDAGFNAFPPTEFSALSFLCRASMSPFS